MDLDVSSLASSGRDVVQTTLPRPHQDASQRVHPGPFDPSAEDAAFFGQVTRSTPGQFVIPQGRPGNQALRSALRTESQAIFIHMAPLLEYARDTFDVARAVITVFRKDTLELYDGDERPVVIKASDSLCKTTVTQAGGTMVIPDLEVDPRFSQSPARHQVLANGRLDFYAGAVLDMGADTDVPTSVDAAITNEDCIESAGDYEPLIALLCIFDDKPRHDFDDASLRRLVRMNAMLSAQLSKITADHIIMRRLRLQQASLRYLQSSSRQSVSLGVEGLSVPIVLPDLGNKTGLRSMEPTLVQPVDTVAAEEKLLYEDLIQNVADAIDGASVCLLDASNFKVIVNEHGDRNGHPISPKSGPDKAWLHDDLTVNLDIGASDDVRVAHIGTSPLPETLAHGSSAHTPYRFFRPRAAGHQEAMVRAMQSSLADGQRWWSSTAIEDTYLVDLLERSPGSSRHVLIVPAWGSKGSPAVVLAMAFDTMPTDRADIEAFAKSIMTGVINRLSLRRAQSLEQEDETFLAMQPHELRTPLHQLSQTESHDTAVETLISEVENAAGQLDRIANNILTYISTKTLRQTSLGTTTSSTSGLGSVDPGGESIEEILASIVPDAIALDRSRRTKPVHIETIVEFERPSLRNCRSPSQSHILPSILASLIDNALRAIPDATEGHVRIVVADRTRLLVPIEEMNAVQPLSPTVNVAFIIEDSGVGMSPEFLATGYFRPMQKQDEFALGSGLSIHLAQKKLQSIQGMMAVESKLGWGTTVHVEVPMTRSDAPSTPWVDQPHDPTRLRRSFHLHGFTQRGRPEGRQTGQIVTGYLKSLGLEGASEIDRADILVIREDAVATVNHALISGFNGQEIWIVNSHAGLHRDYEQYRTKTLRHVPLPVMLSAVGRWLAKEVDTDTSRRIPNVPKSSGPAVSGSQISAERPNASFDDERPRVRPWVLVVDDNVINRKILARNLAGMKLEICHAKDGLEAFNAIKARKDPVLVLLDINMPVLNGFEASVRIRELERLEGRPACTIVAVTALSKPEDVKRGIDECGMDSWLTKPVARAALIAELALRL